MNTKTFIIVTFLLLAAPHALAQDNRYSVANVYKIYLQNSGPIVQQNEIKGYFLFYQSDKIDRHTYEYTLSILDQNVRKVKEIKFDDDKGVNLLEAAYNGYALMFLFHNTKEKMLETRVYDVNGALKFSYSKELDRRTEYFIDNYVKLANENNTNKQVYSIGDNGFAAMIPIRDGGKYTYELDYFNSSTKGEWDFVPAEDDEKWQQASFLGNTDSLIFLEVIKKMHQLSGKPTSSVVALNYITHKKVFELDASKDTYQFTPQYCTKDRNTGQTLLMGSYYDKTANLMTDFSLGLAIYTIAPDGTVLSKTYNSWANDIGKFLPMNQKGKIDDIGYLYFHNMIQAANGNFFAVGEGYKRTADALGIGLNVLGVLSGQGMQTGNTKIKITDMVILQFGADYKITGATIQQKNPNNFHTEYADLNSQHLLAAYIKAWGGFDYAFTISDRDASNFSVCYDDYERTSDYKGETFHALRYTGKGFKDDRLELASEASRLRVLPAKPGFVMIMEYFRKDKRLDVRLEKMN